MAEQKDIMKGIWAVVITNGTNGLIGRLAGLGKTLDHEGKITEGTRNAIFGKPIIQLDMVFDYFAPLRPMQVQTPTGPQMQWARDPLITAHDFMSHPCLITARWERIELFEDMHPEDRATYVGFVMSAVDDALRRRAMAAGIMTPSGDKGIEEAIAAAAAQAKNGGPSLLFQK